MLARRAPHANTYISNQTRNYQSIFYKIADVFCFFSPKWLTFDNKRTTPRAHCRLDMHGLLIKNGTVIDGTGNAPQSADVAVTDGKITNVGRALGSARRSIDADGLLVTPGWIDIHTHYDARRHPGTNKSLPRYQPDRYGLAGGGTSGVRLRPAGWRGTPDAEINGLRFNLCGRAPTAGTFSV